jgi:MoaA/NifB/PqqE/SkfB family radical SAM enzyme
MCSVKEWTRPHGAMSDETFDIALSQLCDFKDHLKSVALFLDGEPLLDLKLEDRIASCKSAGIPEVGFTSNGFLMSDKRARRILEAAPDWVVYSFESLSKETYENIRIRLKFERVRDNILRFIHLRNKMGAKTRIITRFIEQDLNRGEFDAYFDFFFPKLNPDLDEIHYMQEHNWGQGNKIPEEGGALPCGFLDHQFILLRDGSVPLCCVDFNAIHLMGNIRDTHILDIFNSPKWIEYRKIHQRGDRGTLPLCKTCNLPELNEKGSLNYRMTPTGTVISQDAFKPFENEKMRTRCSEDDLPVAVDN